MPSTAARADSEFRTFQAGHCKRRSARGGRPVGYDVEDYKQRNVVERFF